MKSEKKKKYKVYKVNQECGLKCPGPHVYIAARICCQLVAPPNGCKPAKDAGRVRGVYPKYSHCPFE